MDPTVENVCSIDGQSMGNGAVYRFECSFVGVTEEGIGMGRAKFRTLKDLYESTNHCASESEPFDYEMEEKSRSCNLCDTWFTLCVHFERMAASVGVGSGYFTEKTSEGKRTSRSRCSSGDRIPFSSSLRTACDCRQRTSSEASNVCSVSSSHDSFSTNTENQSAFTVSYSCKVVESLSNVRKAQSCRGSGDTPKDERAQIW